jgi:hypothetical protein
MKTPILFTNCIHRSLERSALLLIPFLFGCFGLLPKAQAVSPPPDGGYAGGNTAEGASALFSLTTGLGNTAVGWFSLRSNTEGRVNTATGAGALLLNTTGEVNTATGALALFSNIDGHRNNAVGFKALFSHTTGDFNNAVGAFALFSDTGGFSNNALGDEALFNNTGSGNTAMGDFALGSNTTGNSNSALGIGAGINQDTGSGNVYIGAYMSGVAGENNSCYIASIFGQLIDPATALVVGVDGNGKLGTAASSRRFKHDIKPMDKSSEAILALKPVTFHYKSDAKGTPQFGLIAEEVAAVNPNLVVCDKNGELLSVRYEAVNAMLLNEFLKEHRKVDEQEATIAQLRQEFAKQRTQIEALTAGLQKVSDQLELSKPAPQVIANNH